jgi:hypothetical protein
MTALASPLSGISFIILTASRSFASRRKGLKDSLFDPLTGLCIIPLELQLASAAGILFDDPKEAQWNLPALVPTLTSHD